MNADTGPSMAARADWGTDPPPGPAILVAAAAAVGAGVCVVAAVLGWLVAGAAGSVVAGGAAVVAMAVAVASQRARVLKAAGATVVAHGDAPRLTNLVEGLARVGDAPVPAVMIIERPDPNALVWAGRRPLVAMSRGAVEGFTRTEIEAVVAHCLTRLRSGRAKGLPIAILLGRLAGRTGPLVSGADDIAAVATTRYPPALRSALAKCTPARGRHAPAFFAAEGWAHTPIPERMRALEDI